MTQIKRKPMVILSSFENRSFEILIWFNSLQILKKIMSETSAAVPHEQSKQAPLFDVVTLTITWSIVANFAIIFAIYRHRLYCYYIHMLLSWGIVIFTFAMTLWILVQQGFLIGGQQSILQSVHNSFGLLFLLVVFLQAYLGATSRIMQENYFVKSKNVIRAKFIHRWTGYSLLLIAKFLVITGWYGYGSMVMFYVTIGWESLWLAIVLIRKAIPFPKLEKTIVKNQMEDLYAGTKKIATISDIQETTNFIVFANYVWDLTPLYSNHPAGYQVVDTVKGRQIDRFIYGMYSSEKAPQVLPYSHTEKSLELLGNPIAKLQIPSSFKGLEEINTCQIIYNLCYNKRFYVIGFKLITQKPLQYIGYKVLQQFGQYYAINIDSTTRLYTTVDCLRHQNLALISRISKKIKQKVELECQNLFNKANDSNDTHQVCSDRRIQQNQMSSGPESFSVQYNQIPIMYKKYETGKLTPILSSCKYNDLINVSSQRGIGMRLETLKEGNIIFIAGGTGLCPYMDIIDLLFKYQICKSESVQEQKLIEKFPIITNEFFSKFKFNFMIAVRDIHDIHPLTLFQLKYLVQANHDFRCVLKIKQKPESFSRNNPGFSYVSQHFEGILRIKMKKEEFSKMYICGPPRMNQDIFNFLESEGIPQSKFMIV